MEHRCKIKRSNIFKYIINKTEGKRRKKLIEYDDKLKTDFKELRLMLTQTSVGDEEPKDVIVKKDIMQYSPNRTLEILTLIYGIENNLLEVRVIINSL